eukprot:CAMPEP_0182417730 /NCGR_PEP_ID=MMETSP1167-20130531/2162_1 /TAXON_ID=2988 /ORGANISM="Mallomonas Sp, Strain CCMP3275" /LENGTH=336 /DNA_ID=CAMNT_0024591463 /DNA_START=171 /DNA_END=1181 /DNA_ORIENTATION=+
MATTTSGDYSSTFESIIAGSVSGLVSTMVCHPFDTVRTRIQAAKTPITTLSCVSEMVRNEGSLSFYKGFWSPLAAQGIYKSVGFGTLSFSREVIFQHDNRLSCVFYSGAISGFVNSIMVTPVELIRTKQVLHYGFNNELSVITAIRDVVQQNGVKGMWRGFLPTVLRDGPGLGLYFLTYEYVKRVLASVGRTDGVRVDDSSMWKKMVAGSCAGISYWLYGLPIDTVKTIIQSRKVKINSHPFSSPSLHNLYSSPLKLPSNGLHTSTEVRRVIASTANTRLLDVEEIVSTLQSMSKGKGGLMRALLRAYPVALLRGIPSAAITLTSYDLVLEFLRKP